MYSGPLKQIDSDFPHGTYVSTAVLIEAIGIGPGKISSSGSSVTGQVR
ncbi:MAG: hypothetical protein ACRD8Z_14830 [Nitrososphaeraceae archaeon]